MPLTLRFQGGKLAGQVKTFPDELEIITIGRNPDRCQVIFPPDETHVGREHCALKRSLGRYRLLLNGEDRVLVNGREGYHEEELPASADLRLGPAGPQIVVTTSDASGLPLTVARGAHQPGVGTMLQRDKKRSNRGVAIAILSLIAVIIAAKIGYDLHQKTVADLAETNTDAKNTAAELAKTAPDIADHLRAIKGSVYLVVVRNIAGNETSCGTAWVIANQTLVTNGHIGEIFNREIGPTETMFVRSPTNPPHDFVVNSATIHPGFHDFDKLVRARLPSLADYSASGQTPITNILACDVALLSTLGADLAPAIPLASDDEINSLKVGDVIGMVGYPSENINGHNTANPEPSTQVGRIARQTDFFMRTDGPIDDQQLIHHSVPETGGSSGSPIINADGKVIAINSAASFMSLPNGARIPIAVGLNFAQRADLIRELLDHRADDNQKARHDRWQQELGKYTLGAPAEDDARNQEITDWISGNPGNLATEINRYNLTLREPYLSGGYSASTDIQIPAAGAYLFCFFNLYNYGMKTSLSKSGAVEPLATSDRTHGSISQTFDAPTALTLGFSANESSEVVVVVYRLDPAPATQPAQ